MDKSVRNVSTIATVVCSRRRIKQEGRYSSKCTLAPVSLPQAQP